MVVDELLERFTQEIDTHRNDRIPADHVSRQVWQKAVEQLIVQIREQTACEDFFLTRSEISVFFHKTHAEFAEFINKRIEQLKNK